LQRFDSPHDRVASSVAVIEAEAVRLDRDGGFPEQAFTVLREAGALTAPLPRQLGGCGLGTEPGGAMALLDLLRLLGGASLAVGRLYEGHVNALKLIALYGSASQLASAAADAAAGHLFGIWVTGAAAPLRLVEQDGGYRLEGEKRFASGALHVTRPLVTALPDDAAAGLGDASMHMVLVPLGPDRRASDTLGGLHGMRAARTGSCDFTGIVLGAEALIGAPGDYLRQPEFCAGAWRGIAVALGGIDRLVSLLRGQLLQRGRHENPHQLTRIGEALIAQETAAMWTAKAAAVAEGGIHEPGDVVAIVGLARIAAEQAGLDVIRLVQRGLGLAAFLQDNPVERVMRDLATYLRQPAPDETLTAAAAWFTARDIPKVAEPGA